MKKLSLVIVLLSLFACQIVKAQTDVKADPRVAPLLKLAANGQSDLVIFGRKATSNMYVDMAVLDKAKKTLSWFTCYGTAYDSTQLLESEYNLIVSNAIDPFVFYTQLWQENETYLNDAVAEYRRIGKLALKDTSYNRKVVYNTLQEKSAHSTLQQLISLEGLIKKHYLNLYLFNSPSPSQLSRNDTFLLHKSLAGKMVSKPDTTIFYATSPLGLVAKITLYRKDSLKMFVYGEQDRVIDSMPLRSGKYTSLLKLKDDVFLLYRGWLEMQSQQIEETLRQTTALIHRQDTSLYIQAYWVENRRQLLLTEARLKSEQQEIEHKISSLTLPDRAMVGYLLQDTYPDEAMEITYLSAGMGFAYTVSYKRGEKLYELSDHRGNVMAAVNDKKVGIDNGAGTVAYYNADIVNANDYYPFGSLIPGRTYSSSDKYRYGFNGKENDNEIKGEGNQQDYGMRVYDSRIGKFLSVDPIAAKYPELTPYQFASNSPISGVDMDGLEFYYSADGRFLGRGSDPDDQSVRLGKLLRVSTDKSVNYISSVDYQGRNARSWTIIHPNNTEFLRIAGLAYSESGYSDDVIKGIPFAVVNHHLQLTHSGAAKYDPANWGLNNTVIKMRNRWNDNTYANKFHFGAEGNPAFRSFLGIKLGDQPDFEKNGFARNNNQQMKLAIEYTIKAMQYLGSNGKFGEDNSSGGVGWQGADINNNDNWKSWLYFHPEHKKFAFKGWSNIHLLDDSQFETTGVNKGTFGTTIFYKSTQNALDKDKKGGL